MLIFDTEFWGFQQLVPVHDPLFFCLECQSPRNTYSRPLEHAKGDQCLPAGFDNKRPQAMFPNIAPKYLLPEDCVS